MCPKILTAAGGEREWSRHLSPVHGCAASVLLWLAVNAVWLWRDHRPPFWDAAHHATMALNSAKVWPSGSGDTIQAALAGTIYPPLVYLVCAPAAWVSAHIDVLTLWMNVVFGLLLATSLLGMARLLEVPWIGVGATLLAFYQPMTIFTSRCFTLDFPLTAMVTFAYWRILSCDRHWSLRNAMVLGAVLGLGQLTKWSFGLYLTPAIIWLVCRRLRSGMSFADWRVMLGIGGVALAVCSWWYLWRWSELLEHLSKNSWEARALERDPPGWSASYLVYYLWVYQSIVPLVAWLAAASWFLWKGPHMGRILALWGLIGDVFLGLAPNKDMRFFLPLVPLKAFISWWGVSQIRAASWRRAMMIMLAMFCLAQLAVLSSHRAAQWLGPLQVPRQPSNMPRFGRAGFSVGPNALPMVDESAISPLIDYLARLAKAQPIRVLVLASDRYHNGATLLYEARRRNLDLQLSTVVDSAMKDRDLWALWQQPFDVIMYRSPVITHFPHVRRNIEVLAQELHEATDRYRLTERLPIPAGGSLEIYAPHLDETP